MDAPAPGDFACAKPPRAKIVLFANTDWYLYNFRLSLARTLVQNGHSVLLLSPPGKYGPMLSELGFRWQPVPMIRRSLNPFAEFNLVLGLIRLFRREAPDVVHGFTIKCAVYGGLAARLAGVKARVAAVAGLGYVFISDELRARMLRGPVRWLLGQALGGRGARLIVQNPTDRALFIDSGLACADQVSLIPGSGVDCGRFRPATTPREPGPLRVLLASRLLWDKGIGEFVVAARSLRASGRDIDFILAGEPDPGNPASIEVDVVKEWVADGVLRWIGHVDDMAPLLDRVDVVVLPSYREGLSKSLIEAAASGKALITTDVPGCRDVVAHEQTGLLTPAREWKPLEAGIARLDDNRSLVCSLGAAARRRAEDVFDETVIVAKTVDVYRRVLPELSW